MTLGASVTRVCNRMTCSRQSYYKARHRRKKDLADQETLLQMIRPIRQRMPRIGGRKLHFMLRGKMNEKAIKIGRDRFFDWLRDNDLLISPKRMYVQTTQSNHRFWIHENLTDTLTLNKPNQLWVSDITYIRTLEGFCYLALTDAYSRKIVGYDISDSMNLEGCLRALISATQTASDLTRLVHHSDRGFQYCSKPYTDFLREKKIRISMATKGNCYENALAERVNGILKNEFNLDFTFKTRLLAAKAVHESVYIYNQHRPHWAINLLTPNECHAA